MFLAILSALSDATISAIPGSSGLPWGRYGLRLTATLYVAVLVALPIATVARTGLSHGPAELVHALAHPVARAALRLTIATALAMALVNAAMGTLVAYVLVRHPFRGRRALDAIIDLPFAIPTLVTGLMLVALLGPGAPIGRALAAFGVRVVYAPGSIVLALSFVTLPFVVRAVQPVLAELDPAEEEAAQTLGASDWLTFRKVVLPAIAPAILTGTLLSFARALGEFGSIVVVAGNIPRRTLTAAVYVYGEIESGDPVSASAMALVLIALSFGLILLVDALERQRKRGAHAA